MYKINNGRVFISEKCWFCTLFVFVDSVGNAVNAAGVDAVTGMETVTQVAGNDPEIQAAYQEQVRLTVRENLASNPDFTAERFPNIAKYFK